MKKKLNIIKQTLSKSVHDSKEDYKVNILVDDKNHVQIEKIALRSGIRNYIDTYTVCDEDKNETIKALDLMTAEIILNRLSTTHKWSDAFIFNEYKGKELTWTKSESEHKYTSTGIKFWRHPEQMSSFKSESPKTIISTHISPEGACNLKCPYCSVTYRDTHNRIEINRIKSYVTKLKEYGLKAVILTGGGEPTLYKNFNELVEWLHKENLSIGLITNGTQTHRISKEVLKYFSWVRVSINIFDDWQNKILFPYKDVSEDCVIGCSIVYTGEHELSQKEQTNWVELFRKVSTVADQCGATYIRVLPNCLLEQNQLLLQHESLENLLKEAKDSRYFQQYKIHKTPNVDSCHQAHFRPYLSEEPWMDGEPGTVYPCDSVVLNQSTAHFSTKYQICKLEDVGDFLERKIKMNFSPKDHCSGCVFTENVEMLDAWKNDKIDRFNEFNDSMKHEEFV